MKNSKIIKKLVLLMFLMSLPFYYSFLKSKSIIRQHLDEDSKLLLKELDELEM